jgi:quercetin dioxygenase-like cupin family protein
MTGTAAPALTVVQPAEGERVDLRGMGVVFKIAAATTGGALSIVEHPFAVGAMTPVHQHSHEDELSFVLEGEIGFRSGDREAVLGPGGYILKPRGEMHAMWNAGPAPARMVEIITPGGFEEYFREMAALVGSGPPTAEAVGRIAGRYGLSYGDPDWLPDVIERFGVQPPPRPE